MENKQVLKQLSQGKQANSTSSIQIPGMDTVKKALKNTKSKQVVDLVLFTAGIYLMFKFGKSVADTIDNQMPTEKSMMDMMRSMQGGAPGMPPAPILMSKNNSFFQEIYANYNQIWQQVLKLPLINGIYIERKAFDKILTKVGIEMADPYCLFLLQTSQTPKPKGQQTPNKNDPDAAENFLIDYKIFLNSAIKALSQENFDSETFIIEHFWKAKFGDHSQQQIPIENFNQAFYQFFNKDAKLLSLDYIEQVLNECFAYLLRKNKKSISKRNFRNVIRRHFKDIFGVIFLSFQQKSNEIKNKRQHISEMKSASNHGAQQVLQSNEKEVAVRDCNFKEDNIGKYINTTYYPDSLDTRGTKFSKRYITTSNSKSLYETSTFHNANTSVNNRSKSTEHIHGQGGNIQHMLNQQSTFDILGEKLGMLNDYQMIMKIFDEAKLKGCSLLFLAIENATYKYAQREVFSQIYKVYERRQRRVRAEKQFMMTGKENSMPYNDTYESQKSISECLMSSNKSKDKRNPLQERQTFSFNNNSKAFTSAAKDDQLEQSYQHFTKSLKQLSSNLEQNKPQQDNLQIFKGHQEIEQYLKLPSQLQSQQMINNFQSKGSLVYSSNTPSHHQYNPLLGFPQDSQGDGQLSTKSSNLNFKLPLSKFKCETQRQIDSGIGKTHYQTEITSVDFGSRDKDASESLIELERKLEDIKSASNTNVTSNSRRYSQPVKSRKSNSVKRAQNLGRNINIKNKTQNENMLLNPSILKSSEFNPKFNHGDTIFAHQNGSQHISSIFLAGPLSSTTQNPSNTMNNGGVESSTFDYSSIISEKGHASTVSNSANERIPRSRYAQSSSQSKLKESKNANKLPIKVINQNSQPHVNPHNQSTHSQLELYQNHHYISKAHPESHKKSKEVVYYEKKYRKSKERMRHLIQDHYNEKTKNEALQKCNYVLGEKVDQLENLNNELQNRISQSIERNELVQKQLKMLEQRVSAKQIIKIHQSRETLVVRAAINRWKVHAISAKNRDLNISRLEKFLQFKKVSKLFQKWVAYYIRRQTRKQQRKIHKLQVKVLRILFKRIDLQKKRKVLNQWKGPFMRGKMMDEVQQDIHFAHSQVKTMRFILSFNKIEQVIAKREIMMKVSGFINLVGLIKDDQQRQEEQKQKINTKDSENKRCLSWDFRSQGQQFISPLPQITKEKNNYSHYNSIDRTSCFKANQDYSKKAMKNRSEQNMIEGFEKVYTILKKKVYRLKSEYFEHWNQIRLLRNEEDRQFLEIRDGIMLNVNGSTQGHFNRDISAIDLDISQDFQHQQTNLSSCSNNLQPSHLQAYDFYSSQQQQQLQPFHQQSSTPTSLKQPCFYKTNEGYFFPQASLSTSPTPQYKISFSTNTLAGMGNCQNDTSAGYESTNIVSTNNLKLNQASTSNFTYSNLTSHTGSQLIQNTSEAPQQSQQQEFEQLQQLETQQEFKYEYDGRR